MPDRQSVVVFVHGWSVTDTETYGGLPQRLSNEAGNFNLDIQIEEIQLGKYISFHDEVRVQDIARAFRNAVSQQLSPILGTNRRFVCITHSTGGPVVREWWHRYYLNEKNSGACPMSHLIMLAPANHGSALAQLGKGRLSRLKFWFGGVEPGQGVLDWLELGSQKSWELNSDWINSSGHQISAKGVFPFVLIGQSIDRAFYDSLNSYTGEAGSDGVVRVAAANLNARYIPLVQQAPIPNTESKLGFIAPELKVDKKEDAIAPTTAMRIISGKSHSGSDMGIMRSVHRGIQDTKSKETLNAIMGCIKVRTKQDYSRLCESFEDETQSVQANEILEKEDRILKDRFFIHDRYSIVIFRVMDDTDHPVSDFDLILTAGADDDPNHLPKGFFEDRQRNSLNPETITYYFNYDVMCGSDPVVDKETGKVIRKKLTGIDALGLKVVPRPKSGFIHYLPCQIKASKQLLEKALIPNGTTLIDIKLRRIVHSNVFEFEDVKKTGSTKFKNVKPSGELIP